MNFGFNTNVRAGDAVYHVQTEDRGPVHPFLDTVVYQAGRVVHKRSACYEDLVGSLPQGEGLARELRARLAQQHRDVVAQLEDGSLKLNVDPGLSVKQERVPSPPERLRIFLLNSDSWLALGQATLEIELRREGTSQPPAGAWVQILFENEEGTPGPVHARADADGRATLQFLLPTTVGEGTIVQIRAAHGDLAGELRFRLRSKERSSAPARRRK